MAGKYSKYYAQNIFREAVHHHLPPRRGSPGRPEFGRVQRGREGGRPRPGADVRGAGAEFREVNAAGGLVSNRRGDYLLISRNGLWDLPKGHQEAGEDIEVTALREVQEETGVDQLQLRRLICVTDHCYLRNDVWHLKHTWWYDMLYTDPTNLTPQREEDITKAAWVAKSSLPPFLKNTYPSILEVFREARI